MSYRIKLAVAFAASTILTVASLGAVVYLRAATHLLQASGSAVERTANEIAVTLSRDLATRANEVQLLAYTDALRNLEQPAKVRAALDALQQRLPVYAWIGVTDTSGRVVAATGGLLEGKDISSRPVFIQGMQGFWMGDVHPAKKLAQLLPQPPVGELEFVDIALPLMGSDGQPAGVLAVHLYWAWANGVRNQALAAHGEGGRLDAYITSASGAPLLQPQRATDGIEETLAAIRAPHAGRWVKTGSITNRLVAALSRVEGSGSFKGFGWQVVVRQPLDAALGSAFDLRREIFWLGVGCAGTFAIAGFVFAGHLSAPVSAIVAAARPLRGIDPGQSERSTGHDLQALANDLRAASSVMERQKEQIVQRTIEAHTDALTGLQNRAAALAHLHRLEQELDPATQELCVLTLDLNGFKQINDRLGHAAGDRVLSAVAKRLRDSLRPSDFVARMGGDEFMAVAVSCRGDARTTAAAISQRINRALSAPIDFDGQPMQIGCSVGAAVWPTDASSIAELCILSDHAMYAAKRAGQAARPSSASRVASCTNEMLLT